MIGASKILTVSYGTFSCTLEGFDEPFNTMKAIAEYFRDLAAEDRYFGAEPPTPDAAMLHRIAEREIQRRVEAKIQDNGVILRTGDAMATPGTVDALPAPTLHPTPILHPTLDDAAISGDSVAARLSKLRGTAAPLAALAVASADSYHEDQDAEDLIANLAGGPLPGDLADVALDELIAAEITAPIRAADEPQANETADWHPEDEADFDLAADLADIDLPTQPDPSDDFDDFAALANAAAIKTVAEMAVLDAASVKANTVDPQEADTQEADTQEADDALLASLGSLIDPDDQELLDDDQDGAEADATAKAAALAEADSQAKALAEAAAAALAEAAAAQDRAVAADIDGADEPVAEPGRLQRARARVIKIRRADAPVPVAAPEVEGPSVEGPSVAVTGAGLLPPEAEAALQAELAALEAELAPIAPETPVPDFDDASLTAALLDTASQPPVVRPNRPVRTIPVAPASDVPVSAVPASDVPASAVPGFTDRQPAQTAAQPVETPAEPRKRIEADGADEAVSRLMAQTNTVMDGAEIKRRQSAIAHLKAAVAATEADRQVAPQQAKPDRQDAYRHDLESVVRPRQTETAPADRPSPLVLVSAQRIDRTPAQPTDAPRVVAPVRPRRISAMTATAKSADTIFGGQDDDLEDDTEFEAEAASAANLFADAESFGDFAERLGAVELPDMLEAAAVYCAQVLGRPQFSRPMVLSQLATLPEAASFSREDGLRVFGTLMRQGRITKIKHGQFAVTDRSPLMAEAMRSAS